MISDDRFEIFFKFGVLVIVKLKGEITVWARADCLVWKRMFRCVGSFPTDVDAVWGQKIWIDKSSIVEEVMLIWLNNLLKVCESFFQLWVSENV